MPIKPNPTKPSFSSFCIDEKYKIQSKEAYKNYCIKYGNWYKKPLKLLTRFQILKQE